MIDRDSLNGKHLDTYSMMLKGANLMLKVNRQMAKKANPAELEKLVESQIVFEGIQRLAVRGIQTCKEYRCTKQQTNQSKNVDR